MNHNHTEHEPLAYSEEMISDWLHGIKPLSSAAARDIERRLGLPDGWMDGEHGGASPQQR
jgi:hypothetical protein